LKPIIKSDGAPVAQQIFKRTAVARETDRSLTCVNIKQRQKNKFDKRSKFIPLHYAPVKRAASNYRNYLENS